MKKPKKPGMKTTEIKPIVIAACGMNCAICMGHLREKNTCPDCGMLVSCHRDVCPACGNKAGTHCVRF